MVLQSPVTAMSATNSGFPVPSITRPERITKSASLMDISATQSYAQGSRHGYSHQIAHVRRRQRHEQGLQEGAVSLAARDLKATKCTGYVRKQSYIMIERV